jgi:hypothetical protein
MLKPSEHRPGYPCDELSVSKHRRLARQVGAFGEFAIKSSADLKTNIYSNSAY